jgi:ribosomal protein S18 acetylase RimI-like enzyme
MTLWRINPLTPEYFFQVEALSKKCFQDSRECLTCAEMAAYQERDHLLGWVCLDPHHVVAYVILLHSPRVDQADLISIGVDPEYRQQGLSKNLLSHALSRLPPTVKSIWLDVRADNLPARSLYRSLGFVPQNTRRDYYGKDQHAEIWRRCMPAFGVQDPS